MWASRGITGLLENVGGDLGHVTTCHGCEQRGHVMFATRWSQGGRRGSTQQRFAECVPHENIIFKEDSSLKCQAEKKI